MYNVWFNGVATCRTKWFKVWFVRAWSKLYGDNMSDMSSVLIIDYQTYTSLLYYYSCKHLQRITSDWAYHGAIKNDSSIGQIYVLSMGQ